MKDAKLLLLVTGSLALLTACGDYSGNQTSTEAKGKNSPDYGSATDVVSSDGKALNTNSLKLRTTASANVCSEKRAITIPSPRPTKSPMRNCPDESGLR